MYLKVRFCSSNDSMLAKEVGVFSFFLLSLGLSDLTVSTI